MDYEIVPLRQNKARHDVHGMIRYGRCLLRLSETHYYTTNVFIRIKYTSLKSIIMKKENLPLLLFFMFFPTTLKIFLLYLQKFLRCLISPLTTEAFEKSSRCLWKESCVSTGIRKPKNTCAPSYDISC